MALASMDEALEWAADYADRAKLFEPVVNARGYADGWKPPTPSEKADIILKIARNAMDDGKEQTGDRRFLRSLLHNINEARMAAHTTNSMTDVRSHLDTLYQQTRIQLDGR